MFENRQTDPKPAQHFVHPPKPIFIRTIKFKTDQSGNTAHGIHCSSAGADQTVLHYCGHPLLDWGELPVSIVKVRSHQTRMMRIAQIIYMLSQCKDAIDNPAALFARITRRELSV